MAVDLNSKPHSLTHIQNLSFDEDHQLAVREIVGVDTNGVVRKVPVGTDGALAVSDLSLPTAGNNPSLVISNADMVEASTKTITKTIGATSYLKTLSLNAGGDVIGVSAWSEI